VQPAEDWQGYRHEEGYVATDDGSGFQDFASSALPGLLRFGHVLTGDPDEAQDLVQEALAGLLRRWRSVRHDNPAAYVRKTMVNVHITRWRRWGSRVRVGEVPATSASDPSLLRSDEFDSMKRALAQVPLRQRTVLVLRYYEDLPDAQIAWLMGCSTGTVKSQAFRGLAALRALLEPAALTGGNHED
jgi:RNA polymerase sigma-70 factor (sigma-E family)